MSMAQAFAKAGLIDQKKADQQDRQNRFVESLYDKARRMEKDLARLKQAHEAAKSSGNFIKMTGIVMKIMGVEKEINKIRKEAGKIARSR
jgi:hypothetical protein